jgi:PAS domain S-box-containing protein
MKRRFSTGLTIGILALVYFISAKLGLSLAFLNENATAVWPPTGIALAAIVLLGYRIWPGILLGAFLANLTTSGSAGASISIAFGNTLEALLGAFLLCRFAGGRHAFDRPKNIFKFVILTGMVSTMVSATIGVTTLLSMGLASWENYKLVWLTWWLGDMISDLMIAPLLLIWSRSSLLTLRPKRLFEAALLCLLVFLVSQVVFGGWSPMEAKNYPLEYTGIPLLLWAAFRFGRHGASAAAFEMSLIATWGTLKGSGPFALTDPNGSLLLLQAFMGIITITALVLASALFEEKVAESQLQRESAFRQAIEDSIPAGIVVSDLQGRQTYVNPFFCTMVGWSKSELTGAERPYLYWPDEEVSQIEEAFNRMLQGRAPSSGFELRFRRKNDERFDVLVLVSALLDNRGLQKGWLTSVSDITEKKKAEAEKGQLLSQIEAHRQRLSSIIASVPGVVWEAWGEPDDASQQINFVSDYVETMLGYRVEEWLATSNFWLTIVHPDDKERAAREAAAFFADGKGRSRQFRWRTKEGEVIWVEAQAVVIRNETGEPIGMRGVTMDITPRKQAEEDLKRKTIEAQQASRVKSQFVSNVSHELRTPLNGVLGYTHLLLDGTYGPLTDRQKMPIERVLQNANDLLYLITNLLDLSKIESGRMSVGLTSVNIPSLLQQIFAGIQPMIEKKGLSIRWNVDPALPVIESDLGKIKQILVNLLSNAVKFTREGEVAIEARNLPSQRGIEVSIRDTGTGMRPEDIPKIFEAFHQVDASATREFGGTGLGLTIVKELAEMLKGEIRVESVFGEGSSFTLFLPYRFQS